MVPFTITKTRTRVDLVPSCVKTVVDTKLEIEYDIQMSEVCKPVFDTVWQTRCVNVCRSVCETEMVCESFTVCRPVTTTPQGTEYCRQPYTELITVPVKNKCGRCGHASGGCVCQTVARTCYKMVPVTREVAETRNVTCVETRMVPVTRWRMVTEQKVESVPVTVCRMVNQPVRVKVPRLVYKSVPKTLVYKTAVLTCEEVPVTVYRPVTRMVPIVAASPQALPSPQFSTGPATLPDASVPEPSLAPIQRESETSLGPGEKADAKGGSGKKAEPKGK